MTKIFKVRALVLDADGSALAIEADAAHVLQLPGGSRKAAECPIKALRREMREELGHTVRIVRHVGQHAVKRNGAKEITDFFVVQIKGGHGRPSLTGREAARGLRVCRYDSPRALRKALKKRVKAHGRSAAQRDLTLVSLAL